MTRSLNIWLRIISTYVENTKFFKCVLHLPWDHLHLRGEYQPSIVLNRVGQGIISTYVENTQAEVDKWQIYQDHLHLRGEYNFLKN